MSYRLAIAISGAVSLGSYEAGVLFEVVRAIGLHNRASSDPQNRIVIDVITGASAGGMTAAILAQKLLFEGFQLDHPFGNHLYQPWVEMADIRSMLDPRPEDDPEMSILSSEFIAEIAEQFLLDRYRYAAEPEPIVHPAAADAIRVGLALSNLNGVDRVLPAFDGAELGSPGEQFTYTHFQDRLTVEIRKDEESPALWERLARAARASGAFPFAFRPLRVPRNPDEKDYRGLGIAPDDFPPRAFTYTDGGVFNNSPLGMAKRLANEVDVEPLDYERRFFLYISPDRKTSTANRVLDEFNARFADFGMALGNAVFQQARFQDWAYTAYFNELVDQFDDRAYGLRELLRHLDEAQCEAIDRAAELLLSALYAGNPAADARVADFNRLKQQFMVDEEARSLLREKGEAVTDVWLRAVQVLEKSGRLDSKDKMTVYTVTASPEELAGEGIAAFAGFFDGRFRQFDYAAGRRKARRFLDNLKQEYQQGGKRHLPLTGFSYPDRVPVMDERLAQAGIEEVERVVREQLLERVSDRAQRLLKQLGVGWVTRKLLLWFFIVPRLRRLLKLKWL